MTPSERIKEATAGMPIDQRAELFAGLAREFAWQLSDDEWADLIEKKARVIRFAYATPQLTKGF